MVVRGGGFSSGWGTGEGQGDRAVGTERLETVGEHRGGECKGNARKGVGRRLIASCGVSGLN